MGRVTAATVLQENGAAERYDDIDQALSTGAEGRIELHYAFSPQLIPPKSPSVEGMRRYRDLLPVGKERILYPLAVGGTPLASPSRLRDTLGVPNLWLKDETRTPTGSNKDRATALVLEHAQRGAHRELRFDGKRCRGPRRGSRPQLAWKRPSSFRQRSPRRNLG